MTRRDRVRRARSCAGRACIPVTSWTGGGPGTAGRWPGRRASRPPGRRPAGRADRPAAEREGPAGAGAGQGPLRGRCPVKTAGALGDDLQERGHRARVEFVTDEAIALLAPRIGTRAACAAAGVPQATWYRRHRISPPPPGRPRSRTLSGSSRGRWPRPSGRRSWTCCTPSGSLTWPPTKSGRRCWTRAPTWDRCPPTTGCCARPGRAVSGARRPPIPPPSSPSWWPTGRTRCTPGTSPSCTARRNGPTTTCT